MGVQKGRLAMKYSAAWVWWILSAAYMGLIFYLSAQPGDKIHVAAPDYVLHALAFGGLSFLLYFALRASSAAVPTSHLAAIVGTVLYGITDELHQIAVPGRDPSLGDLVADAVGAVVVQLFLWWVMAAAHFNSQSGPVEGEGHEW